MSETLAADENAAVEKQTPIRTLRNRNILIFACNNAI